LAKQAVFRWKWRGCKNTAQQSPTQNRRALYMKIDELRYSVTDLLGGELGELRFRGVQMGSS
jgi:hypothetical protein